MLIQLTQCGTVALHIHFDQSAIKLVLLRHHPLGNVCAVLALFFFEQIPQHVFIRRLAFIGALAQTVLKFGQQRFGAALALDHHGDDDSHNDNQADYGLPHDDQHGGIDTNHDASSLDSPLFSSSLEAEPLNHRR